MIVSFARCLGAREGADGRAAQLNRPNEGDHFASLEAANAGLIDARPRSTCGIARSIAAILGVLARDGVAQPRPVVGEYLRRLAARPRDGDIVDVLGGGSAGGHRLDESPLGGHGISRLPEIAGDKPAKQPFKQYPMGYFHIDIAEVRTEEGKLYLFVAVDRASKYAFASADAEGEHRHRQGIPRRVGRSRPLQDPHRAHRQRHPVRARLRLIAVKLGAGGEAFLGVGVHAGLCLGRQVFDVVLRHSPLEGDVHGLDLAGPRGPDLDIGVFEAVGDVRQMFKVPGDPVLVLDQQDVEVAPLGRGENVDRPPTFSSPPPRVQPRNLLPTRRNTARYRTTRVT